MKYLPINPNLFIENRKRFTKEMKANSIAIFTTNLQYPQNGDAFYKFKQNSNFFWLTGIEQENSMLILFPTNKDKNVQTILVLERPQELKEKWDGKRLRKEEAINISGISHIIWKDSIDAVLQGLIHQADNIYLDSNENDRKSTSIISNEYVLIDEMKKKYPLHQYYRAASILKNLRSIKTIYEIELIQKAIEITQQTFLEILKIVKPGMNEFEIEAAIHYHFLSRRATQPAYSCIIASGDNARTLHYINNNAVCKNGDLILMDFGAEYANYCADLTRTIPVNGVFTKRQKELYNACLQIHNFAKSILKAGITLKNYTTGVGKYATDVFLKLGLLTNSDIKNQTPENPAYFKYMYHGVSHHLGIDVHDYGTKHLPLQTGMVLTVEPGIYIEAEQIGIRIENNILLAKRNNIDLMANIPLKAEEIERLMKKK